MRSIVAGTKRGLLPAMLGCIAVAGLVTGCSSDTSGQPTAVSQPTASVPGGLNEELWNPCQSLPDEALRAAKVDPATKDVQVDSGKAIDAFAKACGWQSTEGPYGVGVITVRATQEQTRANNRLVGFRDTRIGQRPALIFEDKTEANSDHLRCYVSVPFAQGTVAVFVDWRYSERAKAPQLPPCDLAVAHAEDLEQYLPRWPAWGDRQMSIN